MREFFGWIDMFFMNLMGLGLILLVIAVVLTIIVFVLEMIFGEPEPTMKTSKKSTAKRSSSEYDWDAADEAQRRFMADNSRSHEESVRLHDMAAREAWDAHMTACDQHQTAVDMHNDFSCGGCDPWF